MRFIVVTFHSILLLLVGTGTALRAYDPLELSSGEGHLTVELVVNDPARGREIPLLVYLPDSVQPAPGILFSHGLGGSRYGSSYLGEHWSNRGYVAIFLQHPGSDETIWQSIAPRQRKSAFERAASGENFRLRVEDVRVVLDQIEVWNREPGHALGNRLTDDAFGMAGHSFGAKTTQAVAGQSFGRIGPLFTDDRIVAALPMSPSARSRGNPADDFGSVSIPWMLMTGTLDTSPIGSATIESRYAVFEALPPTGNHYEVVLHEALHSAFTEREIRGAERNPNHHRAILALSTAFWDAYLSKDEEALDWLKGNGPRAILEPEDRWQRK